MQKKSYLIVSIAIVCLHVGIGLVYDWATPAFEASDEGHHYAVIHHLAAGNPLPVQDPANPETTWKQEGSQPPLYYLMGAALVSLVDRSDFDQVFAPNPGAQAGIPGATHNVNMYRHPIEQVPLQGTLLALKLVRWFSLLLSAGTVWLTLRLARRAFPGQDALAILAAGLVAFNPMVLFINASVNNDNLLMLLSTASLLLILHLMDPAVEPPAWKALALGLLLGMAALTKVSGLVLWPIAAIGVGWGAWQTRSWRRFLVSGAWIAGAALLVSGWWFWRNWSLYGEPLGLGAMVAMAGPRQGVLTLFQLARDEWQGFWRSYWGVFGGFNVLAGIWLYRVFAVLTIGAIAGGLWNLLRRHRPARGSVLILLALFCVLTLGGVVNWTMQTPASQGRLLFGAVAPLSLFMAAGILALARSGWKTTLSFVLVGILCMVSAIVPFIYIAPAYAAPELAPVDDIAHSLTEDFGDAIRLVGYDIQPAGLQPGDTLNVTLFWQRLRSLDVDYTVFVHLTDENEIIQAQQDGFPGAGSLPTTQWGDGMVIADLHEVALPSVMSAPARLRVDIGLYDHTTAVRLPAGDSDQATLGYVQLTPRSSDSGLPNPVSVDFDGQIELVGFQLVQHVIRPGDTLDVTLWWKALTQPATDYAVFTHLVEPPDTVWAQMDGVPQEGSAPTSTWTAGQQIEDRYSLALPHDAPAGVYELKIGFYDPNTLIRLPVGTTDNALLLARIRVLAP